MHFKSMKTHRAYFEERETAYTGPWNSLAHNVIKTVIMSELPWSCH